MEQPHRLGDLQLRILQVLWDQAEATSAEVHEALVEERGLALTTIATMLRKMEARGLVTHRSSGRQFIYRAAVAEDDVSRGMVSDLVSRLFGGNPMDLVHHLVAEGDVDPTELEALRRAIAARESEDRGAPDGERGRRA